MVLGKWFLTKGMKSSSGWSTKASRTASVALLMVSLMVELCSGKLPG